MHGQHEITLIRDENDDSYLDVVIRSQSEILSVEQGSQSRTMIRNKVLFQFGIMLLELAYAHLLRTIQKPQDIGEQSLANTDYHTAERIQKIAAREINPSFAEIVRKCINVTLVTVKPSTTANCKRPSTRMSWSNFNPPRRSCEVFGKMTKIEVCCWLKCCVITHSQVILATAAISGTLMLLCEHRYPGDAKQVACDYEYIVSQYLCTRCWYPIKVGWNLGRTVYQVIQPQIKSV